MTVIRLQVKRTKLKRSNLCPVNIDWYFIVGTTFLNIKTFCFKKMIHSGQPVSICYSFDF